LAGKCDLDAKDNEGNTPLILGALTSVQKNYRAMETLIGLKASLIARNNEGKLV